MGRSARIIVASNRAAAGVYEDQTGPIIAEWLSARSYEVTGPVVVPDGEPVAAALRDAVADGVDLVVTTGGTGISPTDRTPEATEAVVDYEIPGLADAIRAAGLPTVPTAMLSRGRAGVAGRTLVVNLPGSRGGVADGLDVLNRVADHALSQLAGGDHHSPGQAAASTGAPPGSARVVLARVTTEPISVDHHASLVTGDASGAVVTFGGIVRDHDEGRTVDRLDYEAHPTAGEVLESVIAAVAARHPDVQAIAASHRIGALAIGDVALACAVASAHRQHAFAACADLVDTIKDRLPIWKHQVFADGTDEWVNSP